MIAHISLIVKDYDEAIDFFTKKLNFILHEDTVIDQDKRWVLIGSKDLNATKILLAKAKTKEQQSRIGNQTGGRVFLFLYTADFDRDFQNLVQNQIKIVRPPRLEKYGKVAVFADLYGNLWDLIQPNYNQ